MPIDPAGVDGPTRGQAYGPRWRKSTSGLFVPGWVDDGPPEQRILEQSMRLPHGAAVSGWAACRLFGAGFFDGLDRDGRSRLPVPLCVGASSQVRELPGSLVWRDRITTEETIAVHGIVCARPLRALFDAVRKAPDLREAVVAMDMMAAAERVSVSQLRGYADRHPRWEGVRQVRNALDLADEDSRSPNETRMRLVWVLDARLPRPLCNRPVFDLHGELIGVPDLLDPTAGVVGEFDGAEHRSSGRHTRDVAREEAFRAHGLEYFKVTGTDIWHADRVVARMRSSRSRAKWLLADARSWTLDPPGDWEPLLSLDDRFALHEIVHTAFAGS